MRRALVVTITAALAFSACGDDADPDTNTPDTTSLTATSTGVATTTTARRTSTTAATLKCGTVAFTPNSEDAASDITATGLTCSEAEAFVRIAGQRTSQGGPSEVDVESYRCVRTRFEEEPLPRSFYECVNEGKKVTFVRS